MAIQVLLFAALRDAAGVSRVEVEAAALGELLTSLSDRFGEPFRSRLAVASVLVDGDQEPHDSDRRLSGDEEVALLPPFSGG